MFLIINSHGDPGMPHATREECFEIIDGMVRNGIAESGGVLGDRAQRAQTCHRRAVRATERSRPSEARSGESTVAEATGWTSAVRRARARAQHGVSVLRAPG